jgi:hypothetical protein
MNRGYYEARELGLAHRSGTVFGVMCSCGWRLDPGLGASYTVLGLGDCAIGFGRL